MPQDNNNQRTSANQYEWSRVYQDSALHGSGTVTISSDGTFTSAGPIEYRYDPNSYTYTLPEGYVINEASNRWATINPPSTETNQPTTHCPFCDRDVIVNERREYTRYIYYVMCDRCQCRGPQSTERQTAIDLWDKRDENILNARKKTLNDRIKSCVKNMRLRGTPEEA